MNWYVIFVHTGKEELMQRWMQVFLEQGTFFSFVPRKFISERRGGVIEEKKKVIFPGYVFINIDMSFESYYKIKKIPRFLRILNNGNYYSSIRDCEMNLILSLSNNNNIIDYSKVYIENSKVSIVGGPLKGLEGLVKKINKRKRRVTIELEFLNEIRSINLGIELIEKLSVG